MTAIVGVLNRRGVAFAADSAATHTTSMGRKISNNANKIFSLSKYHPVGLALYNNIDFMGVPWDSIIKQYRNSLKDKKYDSLQGYVKPFFAFVRSYCLKEFTANQRSYIRNLTAGYCKKIQGEVISIVGEDLCEANAEAYFRIFVDRLEKDIKNLGKKKSEDFEGYELQDFEKYAKKDVDVTLSSFFSNQELPQNFGETFIKAFYSFVTQKDHVYLNKDYTGLVFFGFGNKDIFPSLIEYHVTYAIDNRIKYSFSQKQIIDNGNIAVISPFAQSDVALTFVNAVDDDLKRVFYNNHKQTVIGFRDEVVAQMENAKAPQGLIDILNGLDIDKYASDYVKSMDGYISQRYTKPLLVTISCLEKEDLADMAESLVRMTCLKRHVTNAEETVGGAVDVAIITKGDGFVWKKRKHYFDPDLNSQFFERYKK